MHFVLQFFLSNVFPVNCPSVITADWKCNLNVVLPDNVTVLCLDWYYRTFQMLQLTLFFTNFYSIVSMVQYCNCQLDYSDFVCFNWMPFTVI